MNMKIVYVTSSFPFGESEVWAINEINSLLNHGTEILIVPRKGSGKIINKDALKFSKYLINVPLMNWRIFRFFIRRLFSNTRVIILIIIQIIKQSNSLFHLVKSLLVLPKSLFLAKILKQKDIDHVHSLSTTSTAVIAHIISVILKIPWSYTLHSSSILNSSYKRSFMFQSNSASLCRTISRITANDLSNFLGPQLSEKVAMVHLGVKTTDIISDSSTKNGPFIIATPAALKEYKGHVYALGAAKKIIDSGYSNFKWYFYGSGPLKKELMNNVKNLNLSENCFFLGNIDHQLLLDKYKNHEIDIVINSSVNIPNIFEGIPVSLMEAMSYSIPVIATDCGSTRELIDGKSGILVNQKDSNALADAVLGVMTNLDYRQSIGKNGRFKILQEFDTNQNARDLIKLFNKK